MRSLARSLPRVALAALVVIGVPLLLSACEQIENFELFDTKKKLTGDRKPVFPDGVPGVASGVPPEMMKGYREPEGAVLDPAKAAAEAAAAEQTARPKPRPPPQRTASKPPPPPKPVAAAPAPRPVAAAPAAAPAQPPAQPSAFPAPTQAAPLPWPTAPPVGTATR
jgi:hypothetical protein